MKNWGMGIKHPKARGEWVELKFMLRATELGLHLSKPWGEMLPYDFVVEHKGELARVQVKSTIYECDGGYMCTACGSHGAYEENSFEYVAAYVIQEDVWYIIPAGMILGQERIWLCPRRKRSKYGPYQEAWHLLRKHAPEPGRVGWIEACVEDEPVERVSLGAWILRMFRGQRLGWLT
jgi:hypothetical protein